MCLVVRVDRSAHSYHNICTLSDFLFDCGDVTRQMDRYSSRIWCLVLPRVSSICIMHCPSRRSLYWATTSLASLVHLVVAALSVPGQATPSLPRFFSLVFPVISGDVDSSVVPGSCFFLLDYFLPLALRAGDSCCLSLFCVT